MPLYAYIVAFVGGIHQSISDRRFEWCVHRAEYYPINKLGKDAASNTGALGLGNHCGIKGAMGPDGSLVMTGVHPV